MDSFLYSFALFLLVLFFYIHITAQYKKSEDLDIYEADYDSHSGLQQICDIRQPFLFEFRSVNSDFFERMNWVSVTSVCGSYDIRIKEIADYFSKDELAVDYVLLPWTQGTTLIRDTATQYFTENNHDFVEDAGLFRVFSQTDSFLKPEWTCITRYDVMTGAKTTGTPLRYHTETRRFLSVQSGRILVKMTPWKSTKYLYVNEDFENYEFWSPINVWNPQKKYLHEMDKLRFIEFDVAAGTVLYIPPYWFYSIQYAEDETLVCGFSYHTCMNVLANLPNWGRYYLQQSNIETKTGIPMTPLKPPVEDVPPVDDAV